MIGDTFTSPLPSRTAMLVAAFDSQLKWAGVRCRATQRHGAPDNDHWLGRRDH
jgi:hypothetical protein